MAGVGWKAGGGTVRLPEGWRNVFGGGRENAEENLTLPPELQHQPHCKRCSETQNLKPPRQSVPSTSWRPNTPKPNSLEHKEADPTCRVRCVRGEAHPAPAGGPGRAPGALRGVVLCVESLGPPAPLHLRLHIPPAVCLEPGQVFAADLPGAIFLGHLFQVGVLHQGLHDFVKIPPPPPPPPLPRMRASFLAVKAICSPAANYQGKIPLCVPEPYA